MLVLLFFSPFSIAITSFGEKRANLSAFRTFVRCVLVWFCWFPLPRCLGRAAVCDCSTLWTVLLFFLYKRFQTFTVVVLSCILNDTGSDSFIHVLLDICHCWKSEK